MYDMFGFTFNKALGGGVAAGLLSLLGFIGPFASHVPLLGAVVGVGTFILTWLTPKNVEPKV
jgi:hypothetical protein